MAHLRAVVRPDVQRIVLVDGPAVVGWDAWRNSDASNSARLLAEGLAALPNLEVDPAAARALLNGAMNEAALWITAGGDPAQAEAGIRRMIASLRRS